MQKKEPKYYDGKPYWQCSKCKKWLPENEYYRDNKNSNSLKSQCKPCHIQTSIETRDKENANRINREHMRRARKTNPDKFRARERTASRKREKNEKTRAREILNSAVATGKIIKPTNCSKCGKVRKLTAHHPDYSKPLEVIWLCYECHGDN